MHHRNGGVCDELEEQLLSFPFGKYDDGIDCLAYLLQIFEIGGRHFLPLSRRHKEPEVKLWYPDYVYIEDTDVAYVNENWRIAP